MNAFGDLFLLGRNNEVHAFWLSSCETKPIAKDIQTFESELRDPERRAEWLLEPIHEQLRGNGMNLKTGECYGWKLPPWLGGQFDIANIGIVPIGQLHGMYSDLYKQVKNLPDGSNVIIDIEE